MIDDATISISAPACDEFRLRVANVSDADELAALFASVYRQSSHPFQSRRDVAAFIADEGNVFMVVLDGPSIVAACAMRRCGWNDGFELGRAVTKEGLRGQGLAHVMMGAALRAVADRRQGQVYFGFPRVPRVADISMKLDPAFVVVGHDGHRHVANGRRETHLIIQAIPEHAVFQHVAPRVDGILASHFVRTRIYEPLGLVATPGDYPAECFALPPTHEGHASQPCGGLAVLQEKASGSIDVVGNLGPHSSDDEIAGRIAELTPQRRDLRHVTVTLLADKSALVRALLAQGFEVSAFLPAWHAQGPCRYDCVQLIRSSFRCATPMSSHFEDMSMMLRRSFADLYGEQRVSAAAAVAGEPRSRAA